MPCMSDCAQEAEKAREDTGSVGSAMKGDTDTTTVCRRDWACAGLVPLQLLVPV